MIILMVILSLAVVVLCGLLYKILQVAIAANKRVLAWEEFYEDSLEDISSVIDMLDSLMSRRQLVSDDPDVQNVYRVIVILHDILAGYKNARITNAKEKG